MAFIGSDVNTSLYPGSSTHDTVYAALQNETYCKYVGEEMSSDFSFDKASSYNQNGDHDLISRDYLPSYYSWDSLTDNANYLGTFGYKENEIVSLSFTVVCWYEGTDPEIINFSFNDPFQKVTSILRFETRSL